MNVEMQGTNARGFIERRLLPVVLAAATILLGSGVTEAGGPSRTPTPTPTIGVPPTPTQTPNPTTATSCWDINDSGLCDIAEDVDESGVCDALDCQGAEGPQGPAGPQGEQGPG
ncbi:MAG: hypothetical protein ACREQJ_07765, partial [Candidatus Binatia bacterium]